MKLFAIADLHLYFSQPDKSMEIFGVAWIDHPARLKKAWEELVAADDLVLIPGDISWAKKTEEALTDLTWIDELPGTKVMIRGNHDYWWTSLAKMNKLGLKSIHFLHNTAFTLNGVSVAGSRLWDSETITCDAYFPKREEVLPERVVDEAIFERELARLEMSLKLLDQEASLKIAMTHYPPIGADLQPTAVSDLLERYGVTICLFGHLHGVRKDIPIFGKVGNVDYILTSCDYLDCIPYHLR